MKKNRLFGIILFAIVGCLFSVSVLGAIIKIPAGGEIFIGESDLDLTATLHNTYQYAWWDTSSDLHNTYQIAWWDTSSDPKYDQPVYIQTITNPKSFFADPDFFLGKKGLWYNWIDNAKGPLAFAIKDPELDIKIWDGTLNKDITNGEIPIGNVLNFEIKSNMQSLITRPGYQPNDALFRIKILGGDGTRYYDYLIGKEGKEHKLTNLPVNQKSWFWISPSNKHDAPTLDDGWNTGALDNSGKLFYKPGFYTVWVECDANNLKNNYKAPDGSDYTGKTVSYIKSIKLLPSSDEKSDNIFYFEELESSNSDYSVEDWVNEGDNFSEVGKHLEAITAYKNALELDPYNPDIVMEIAQELISIGEFDQAIAVYDLIIDNQIDNSDYIYNYIDAIKAKADILSEIGRFEDAISLLNDLIQIEPDYFWGYSSKADAYKSLGRYEEAIAVYDEYLSLDPQFESMWVSKGYALSNIGRYEEAIEAYDKSLLINPQKEVAWSFKAHALSDIGKYEEAVDAYDQSLQLDPYDAFEWYLKGNALIKIGKTEEAQIAYEKAKKFNPNNPLFGALDIN